MPLPIFYECDCCGDYFERWTGYRDQNKEKGYGVCARCQADAEEKHAEIMRRASALVRGKLNKKNKQLFDAVSAENRELIIARLIERGALVWRI